MMPTYANNSSVLNTPSLSPPLPSSLSTRSTVWASVKNFFLSCACSSSRKTSRQVAPINSDAPIKISAAPLKTAEQLISEVKTLIDRYDSADEMDNMSYFSEGSEFAVQKQEIGRELLDRMAQLDDHIQTNPHVIKSIESDFSAVASAIQDRKIESLFFEEPPTYKCRRCLHRS